MKKFTRKGFVDILHILTYGAIYNFIDSVRNTGKTSLFKAWVLMRYIKRGKKCLWLRTFEDEIDVCKHDFYTDKKCKAFDIMKAINVKKYGFITADNIKQEGNYIYFRKSDKDKWDWFIQLAHLQQAQSIKGNEIAHCDTIVYDEYRIQANRLNRYTGNQVTDFINIVVSVSRDHYVRTFLLGNKETFNTPFYDYFRITPPREDWEGTRCLKNGSITVTQINTVPESIASNKMNRKQQAALADTPMFGYLYGGETAGIARQQIVKMPKTTLYYAGFDVHNAQLSARLDADGNVYFASGLDAKRHVWSTEHTTKYVQCARLIPGDKKHFSLIMRALRLNKIYYTDISAYERANELLKIINIKGA